jgi:DNA-binding SARP family transcriptional activator/WD40 repeat protein
MEIRVLGPLELEPPAKLEPRDRVALSAFVVRRGTSLTTDELADAIWGDSLPATWSKQVQICIARLRKTLGSHRIETVAGGYRLVLDGHDLDLLRFEELVGLGRGFAETGEPDRAVTAYSRALSLWRGHPLDDVIGWGPGHSEAGRLEEVHRQLEEDRLEAMLEAGEHRQVAAEAEGLATAEPLRERRWMILALAQYRSGRHSEALRTLLRARNTLAEEAGVDPSSQLVALEDAIFQQDPSLAATRVAHEGLETCPYRGLAPYDEADAGSFFGRDREVALCLDRLKTSPVLVLAGQSGSGKSSLARAGIVPELRRRGQAVSVIVPGRDPQSALAEALSFTDESAALVIDQFEEIYAAGNDEAADDFCRQIVARARQHATPVIIVVRSDHLGELAREPSLRRLVEDGLYLVGPLVGDTLKEAITGPAEQAGMRLEHGLVDLLVRDTEGEPGALPLLSHALAETWARRDGRVLTVEGYNATGGIRGAVARTADRLYEGLPPNQRELVRSVMLRLVSPSLEGDPVRRRLPSQPLLQDAERARVISLLVRSRLITTGDDSVELAHEAIARAWPRLRSWLDEDTDGQRILRHLNVSADSWDSMGRPGGDLYRGARLMAALEWWEKTQYDLTDVETAFLEESKAEEESEARVIAERASRERRQNRRLRILLGVGGLLLFAVIVAGVLAVQSRLEAQVERDAAESEAKRARASELSAYAVNALDTDPPLAKLLAVASAQLTPPTIDTLSVLHRVWAADQVIASYLWTQEEEAVLWTDLHPDGSRLVSAGYAWGASRHLEVADLLTGDVLWSFDTGNEAVGIDRPRFSNDGEHVVAGVSWSPLDEAQSNQPDEDQVGVFIWDAQSGELIARLDFGPCGAMLPDVSATHLLVGTTPDGEPNCFTGVPDETDLALELIDLETGERQVLTMRSRWQEAHFSGDGRFVAFRDDSGSAPVTAVVELGNREPRLEFDPTDHAGPSLGIPIALNHDGSLLLAGNRPIAVWNVENGDIMAVFDAQEGETWWAEFSGTDDTVFSSAQSGILHHWDALTGEEIKAYPTVGMGRVSLVGERALVTDVGTRTANLVDVGVRGEIFAHPPPCVGFVTATSVWTTSRYVALRQLCEEDDTKSGARSSVIDIDKGEVALTLMLSPGQGWGISADGTRLVLQEQGEAQSGDSVGPIVTRGFPTGEVLVTLEGLCTYDADSETPPNLQEGCSAYPRRPFPFWNTSLLWSPDSKMIAAYGDPLVIVWDATTGAIVHEQTGCEGGSFSPLVFSADSRELIAFCDGSFLAWSTDTWEQVRTNVLDDQPAHADDLAGLGAVTLMGTPPDGSVVVGIGRDGEGVPVIFWLDPDTLEIQTSVTGAFEAGPKSWALSPDGTLAAVGTSDGWVSVWGVEQRQVVHEIFLGGTEVQGVGFVNNQHLAVAPYGGGIYIYTLDPKALVDLVSDSLSRGFTQAECDRFGFDDHCPTLEELQG